ncbi:hypothetical protein AVEN_179944-1 [Araneus ventricosus]|uniref:Uncharacterized protein n=1 Tax=Araneus ventricosus TaxID=182803 RepID=A0A4Y2TI12_ARAVE|nr:hypothetical protein AVEN_179944-1 [Araneus ventricosus]
MPYFHSAGHTFYAKWAQMEEFKEKMDTTDYKKLSEVQQWWGNKPDPTEWGWFMKDGRLNPLPSTLPAASEELLKLIPCNCKITLTRDSEEDANARRQTFTVQSFVPLCLVETCKNSASPTSGFEDDDDDE